VNVETPLGPARVLRREPDTVSGSLVLGHGAGGGIAAPDLDAVSYAACAAGWRVLGVEQPWRVAGRRIAPAPPRLDLAWTAVLEQLRSSDALAGPLVLGGRSAGARVACRTASAQGAAGVLALAFPLHPPGRPEKSRAHELALVDVPLLVVKGETDAFGGPGEVAAAAPHAQVAAVAGDHALKKDVAAVAAAVLPWLADFSPKKSPDLSPKRSLSRGGGGR
jgi:predicted alpha/beta-hydrolase family hydrolase